MAGDERNCLKIAKNLQKGDLLLWKSYKLRSGGKKDKILIVLNNYKNNIIFFVLTTSKTKLYDESPGESMDIIRIPANKIKCFSLETIIDLKQWQIINVRTMGEKFYNNVIRFIGKLPDEEIKNIDLAIEKAYTLSKEIKNQILEN